MKITVSIAKGFCEPHFLATIEVAGFRDFEAVHIEKEKAIEKVIFNFLRTVAYCYGNSFDYADENNAKELRSILQAAMFEVIGPVLIDSCSSNNCPSDEINQL